MVNAPPKLRSDLDVVACAEWNSPASDPIRDLESILMVAWQRYGIEATVQMSEVDLGKLCANPNTIRRAQVSGIRSSEDDSSLSFDEAAALMHKLKIGLITDPNGEAGTVLFGNPMTSPFTVQARLRMV